MTKALFIYGYGGSPESTFCTLLRELLPSEEYEIVSFTYPQENCKEALEALCNIIKRENIDMVIGTSLGGFLTLALDQMEDFDMDNIERVVINPAAKPSETLSLLKPRPDHPEDVAPSPEMIASYEAYEKEVLYGHKQDIVMGFFAKEDELLGLKYLPWFNRTFYNAKIIRGGHHGNREGAKDIAKGIMKGLSERAIRNIEEHISKRSAKNAYWEHLKETEPDLLL